MQYMWKKFRISNKLLIGERTAEKIKQEIGTVMLYDKEKKKTYKTFILNHSR